MSSVEWFYAKNNQQFGPISPTELRQLAQAAQLGPDDLVWRQGMEAWTAAGRVKGLFDSGGSVSIKDTPSVVKDSPLAEEAPAAKDLSLSAKETPAAKDVPAVKDTLVPPRDPRAAVRDSRSVVRDSRVAVKDSPAPSKDTSTSVKEALAGLKIESATSGGDFEGARSAFEGSPIPRRKAPRPTGRHVLDHLLAATKRRLTVRFVEATATMFRACGYYGLYLAMAAAALFALVGGMKGGPREAMLLAVVVIPLLVVLQYVAYRFLEALARLNRATPGQLDSSAVLDCFALLSFLAGMAALVGLAILAAHTQALGMALAAIAAFILCQYLAVIAINPDAMYVTIDAASGAGEEALGLVSCLLKMILLELIPVAFGVGVACGTVGLVYAIVVVLLGAEGSALLATTSVWSAIGGLCLATLLPVIAYATFLVLHLGIDVFRGLIRLAETDDPHPQNGSRGLR